MNDIVEVLHKDPIKGDENFFGLKFDGVDFAFQISEENTWEDDWIYRIYHFDSVKWKRIDPIEFLKIKELLRTTALLYNSNNMISADLNSKDLIAIWKQHFPH